MERLENREIQDEPIGVGDTVLYKGERFVVLRNRPCSEDLLGEVVIFSDLGDRAKVVFLNTDKGLKRIEKENK